MFRLRLYDYQDPDQLRDFEVTAIREAEPDELVADLERLDVARTTTGASGLAVIVRRIEEDA